MQNLHTRYVTIAIAKTPPITPPAMAPTLGPLFFDAVAVAVAVELGAVTATEATQLVNWQESQETGDS